MSNEKALALRSMLDRREASLNEVLPAGVSAKKLITTAMLAINRNPNLLRCSQVSILESVTRAAELGLTVSGTMGDAYLVPFGKSCQLIPGWQGIARLARNSGLIDVLEAEVVYENDHFRIRRATGANQFEFERLLKGDRGEAVGAYARAVLKDGSEQVEYMSREEIEQVRSVSRAKDGDAWTKWWSEMWRKTVFRRLAKWLPKDPSADKLIKAIELSDAEYQVGQREEEITVEVAPEKTADRAEALANAIASEPAEEPERQAPDLDELAAKLEGHDRATLTAWIDDGPYSDILGNVDPKMKPLSDLRAKIIAELEGFYDVA